MLVSHLINWAYIIQTRYRQCGTRVRYGPVDFPAWLRAGKVMDIEEGLLAHLHEVAGVSLSQDAAPLRLELDSARRGRAVGRKASRHRSGPASRNRRPGRR